MCFCAIWEDRNSSTRRGCAAPANTPTYKFTTHLGARAFCITLTTPSCRSVLPKTRAHQIRSRKKSKSSSCKVFESHVGSLSPFPGLRLCHVRLKNKSLSANCVVEGHFYGLGLPSPPPSPPCQAQKGMWWHITCHILQIKAARFLVSTGCLAQISPPLRRNPSFCQ